MRHRELHRASRIGWLRAAVLGANDGLISTASLVVGVNTDASVRRLGKGQGRPVNGLDDRMALLAALESVSLVTWFDDDTPLELIRAVQPEVLVKGGDWPPEKIVGADLVQARGGRVCSIPFRHARSTSALLAKIRSL